MSRVSFNLAAKCDKAGRSQNQDNYWVCPDLSRIDESFEDIIGKDVDVPLSDKGALLVVADGMGGMNAGEKASELVIEGVKKGFANIPEDVPGDEDKMLAFIRDVITSADQSIKDYAKANRDAEGLGSTIVLLWLWNEKAFCGWCGDSRIYRYNPNNSLVRLSHDHSYVQELVDDDKIDPDDAFDHPDGNIITRSLGDNGEKANPELKVYDVCERDMFLLCSDGLCGLIQDKQIENIISLNCSSTKDALAALWKAGETEGWSDNATIDLLNIVEGGARPKGVAVGYPQKIRNASVANKHKDTIEVEKNSTGVFKMNPSKIILLAVAAIAIILLVLLLARPNSKGSKDVRQQGDNTYEVSPSDFPDNNSPSNNGTNGNANPNISGEGSLGGSPGNRPGNNGSHLGNNSPSNGNTPTANGGNTSNGNANNAASNGDVASHTAPHDASSGIGDAHQTSPQDVYNSTVSTAFESLLNGTDRDYASVRNTWIAVKQRGWRDRNESSKLNNYLGNVSDILRNQDKEPLNTNQLKTIAKLKNLYDEIEKNIRNYPEKREILPPDGYHLYRGGRGR